jgi:hypothetical protein
MKSLNDGERKRRRKRMGYHTDFRGIFQVTPRLKKEHAEYLSKFCETRRMKRDPSIAETLPDPLRERVGLPIGDDGGYFVGGTGVCGQDRDVSIVDWRDYNTPPGGQPGLWCQWTPTEGLDAIEWDGGEKFYEYFEWIKYLIEHFIKPWGYVLNGEVEWRGEDWCDTGVISIKENNAEIDFKI